jgi:hypothetical protein
MPTIEQAHAPQLPQPPADPYIPSPIQIVYKLLQL